MAQQAVTSHIGFHIQDKRVFEIFFHPYNDQHGTRGWYWWDCDRNGQPLSEDNPSGPFETSEGAFSNASLS